MKLICLTLLIIRGITDSRAGNYSHPYKELKCVFMSINRLAELYLCLIIVYVIIAGSL